MPAATNNRRNAKMSTPTLHSALLIDGHLVGGEVAVRGDEVRRISTPESRLEILVVPTDEERAIAEGLAQALDVARTQSVPDDERRVGARRPVACREDEPCGRVDADPGPRRVADAERGAARREHPRDARAGRDLDLQRLAHHRLELDLAAGLLDRLQVPATPPG